MSLMPFPETGYITSVVQLDCWMQITTDVATKTRRHRAVILIGNTNYKIMIGDVLCWGAGREIFFVPASESLQQTVELRRKGLKRRLSLNRVLSQETQDV